MGSKIGDMLKTHSVTLEGGNDINKDIKNDKKINKEIKSIINAEKAGGKKRGRPPKDPGTKKEKLNLNIEPKYREVLQAEADEKGLDLGPYIISNYIIEPLRKKYKNL